MFQEGVPAFTVIQPNEGMAVLEDRAQELKASVDWIFFVLYAYHSPGIQPYCDRLGTWSL
jgi:hypothetical protein